ncbi:unnamed protein product [Boreogadus saida]
MRSLSENASGRVSRFREANNSTDVEKDRTDLYTAALVEVEVLDENYCPRVQAFVGEEGVTVEMDRLKE